MNTNGPAQPRPLRIVAAATSAVTLILGGLPTLGVPLTPEVTGWLMGVVGTMSGLAVALIGEQKVTPITSPRDNAGQQLTPDTVDATT